MKSTIKQKHKLPDNQTNLCSITGVNPPRTHGFGVWGNERVVVSFRCDKKLYEAFKPVALANYGSVCRPIESFMATVVATNQPTNELGVYPRNTIEIGKVVIERNLRTRRRMVVDEEVEKTERKKVVVAKPEPVTYPKRDYSKLSLEEVQRLFDRYVESPLDHFGEIQLLGYELKRRRG